MWWDWVQYDDMVQLGEIKNKQTCIWEIFLENRKTDWDKKNKYEPIMQKEAKGRKRQESEPPQSKRVLRKTTGGYVRVLKAGPWTSSIGITRDSALAVQILQAQT